MLILLRLIQATRGEGWEGENFAPLVAYTVKHAGAPCCCFCLSFSFWLCLSVHGVLGIFVSATRGAAAAGLLALPVRFFFIIIIIFFFFKARVPTYSTERVN